jgi:hypothetical protein
MNDQDQNQTNPENNLSLTGDESRLLMASLLSSSVKAPTGAVLNLYLRLSQISNVQPPAESK